MADRLVVGLGNPGCAYANTRHNIGFAVIDALSGHYCIPVDEKRDDIHVGYGHIQGFKTALAKPMSFMNRSGPPVLMLLDELRISRVDMIVAYDDMDLALGQIKIKEKGGHGGHKGVRSLVDALGCDDFPRLRLGIGRPPAGMSAVDFVLGRFDEDETELVDGLIARAREAVVTVLCHGTKAGMNLFNRKPINVQMEVKN